MSLIDQALLPYLLTGREDAVVFVNGKCQQGQSVQIEAGVVLDKPIQCFYITTAPGEYTLTHDMAVGKNSQCSLIETYLNIGEHEGKTVVTSTLKIDENAKVRKVKLFVGTQASEHQGRTQLQLAQDAQLNSFVFSLGGATVQNHTQVDLNGIKAEANLLGVYLGEEKQRIEHQVQVNHRVPECNSREFYKGILTDSARATFTGKVVVAKDAQQTNADMTNKNLLLSRRAEANSKPELEIYADDVKCSHGATVGELAESSLFYLKSRGIPENQARAMLITGFADEVLDELENEQVKTFVHQQVAEYIARSV